MSILSTERVHLSSSKLSLLKPYKERPITKTNTLSIEEEIVCAANKAYSTLSLTEGVEVHPWDKLCDKVCEEIVQNLSADINIDFIEYEDDDLFHVFLILELDGNKWLVDPTYQQFVNENDREWLPPVMMFQIDDKEDLIESLENHGIDEEFYQIWINSVCNLE